VIELRPCLPEDQPEVARFLAVEWDPHHPVLDPALFAWQYAGPGEPGPVGELALDAGRVVGFLGAIPTPFLVPGEAGARVAPGHVLAMWMVEPALRASGVGVHLLRRVEARGEVTAVLGVNEVVRGFYHRLGYRDLGILPRWVASLAPGYAALLPPGTPPPPELKPDFGQPAEAVPLDGPALAARAPAAFGPVRDAAHYAWRYGASPGYRYLQLGSGRRACVARVEACEPGSVMRLVDLPADPKAIRAALAWGQQAGCAAADYQAITPGLDAALAEAGMAPVRPEDPWTALASGFRPVRFDLPPIRALIRAAAPEGTPWSFLKTDGDMDRPTDPWPGGGDHEHREVG
jgi:GNAT superfamily N-acetyltransferase